ncbi:hypothetical protein [Deinococcus cellulosilyticus]|uniref:Uncharacterized protein n=1 Tax=Deinococcus cellulosilyticus (strain DSM 18568 / NBRC 106333 / KACC 11606 / 5516J-15) TaxID=1223518 RepID=A0A511N8A9_DEIC1|nr:hypothetical protein [Deinococcus cellulosilyticus]GEM49073.1 hypothetical protein DC3_47080 [Deinococcus cellulosilyticus NBRC 106333 = KACC 11606]
MARTASLILLVLLAGAAGAQGNTDLKQYALTSLVMAEDQAAAGKSLSFPLACKALPGNSRVPASVKTCELGLDPSGKGFRVTGVSKTGQKYTATSQGIRQKNSGVNVSLIRMTYQFLQDTYLQAYVRQTQLNLEFWLSSGKTLEGALGACNRIPNNQKQPPEVAKCQIVKNKTTYTIQATGVRGNQASVTGPQGKIQFKK